MASTTAFIATCDLAAIVRGRAVPDSRVAPTLETGVGWVPADLALTAFGPIAPDNMFGSTGDLRLLPDTSTNTLFLADDLTPETRIYLADQRELDGSAWGGCPRTALKDALAELHDYTGLRMKASFEHEFTMETMAGGAAFSFERARMAEPFGTELVGLMAEAGMDPESWLPEYGVGQFEVTTRPAEALVAADRAILLRELVRDLARRRGHRATFAPILDPAGVGNGVHIHFSLFDEEGNPAMFDDSRPGRLSELAGRFSSGVLQHANAVVAMTAPSVVSYLRLTPHRWSAGGAFLAERNREALLRIAPTVQFAGAMQAPQLHLEYRAADATANPWLALAAIVKAGVHGVLNGYEPAHVWPESATETELAGVPMLPSTLPEALDALEADAVAQRWFSPLLLNTFLAVKRYELELMQDLTDAERCRRVADVY